MGKNANAELLDARVGMRSRALWIDWGRHVRTHSLTRRLGVDLIEIVISGNRALRYLLSMKQTIGALRARRPSVVIATNPSIVLGLFLLLYRRFSGFKLISDAHYAGVDPPNFNRLLKRILDLHNRSVDLVVVPTETHALRLTQIGASAYVCPDPLPHIPTRSGFEHTLPEKSVLLVCSFDLDEPFSAAFEAFDQLREDGYSLVVSGNYARAGVDPERFPWVQFLGFVSERDYFGYLQACSVVMDLTELEDCLVCGAYEALALHKPLILSDSEAMRAYFGDACVLTENASTAIVESVRQAFSKRDELIEAAQEWTRRNETHIQERLAGLQNHLQDPSTPPTADSGSGRTTADQ